MSIKNPSHKWFKQYQKVFVIMRDGEKFVDRFIDQKNNYLIFKKNGKIKKNLISSTTIWRPS